MKTEPKQKALNSKFLTLNSNSTNGFTFVELLVVVTIIVLLSAIGLASYSQVNKKSRDSKRKSDLEQIRAALEIYRTDQSAYPATLDTTSCSGTLTQGSSTYMDPIPCDPTNNATQGYTYLYTQVSDTQYTLEVKLEVDTATGTCTATSPRTYCVKQP